MSEPRGPWHRDAPPPAPPRAPRRGWRLVALLAGVGVLLFLLSAAFPGRLHTADDWSWLAQGLGALVVVSAGVLSARQINWGQKARHAAIWVGIVGVLFVIAAYRDELEGVSQRLRSQLSGAYPVAAGERRLVVTQDDQGGFFVMGKVNGQPVRFLVDTGASDTVLSPDDAHRLGLDTGPLRYDRSAETANGIGHGALVTANSVAVGSIELRGLPVLINQAPMTSSLLGMTFLSRLESFQVRGRRLYLTGRP